MKNKTKRGRPSKYKPEYCTDILEYFNVAPYRMVKGVKVANDMRFISAYARHIKVCEDTIYEWAKVHPKFSESLKKVKKMQLEHLVTNGLLNLFAQPFAIFTMKNICGWRDKKEIEHKGAKEQKVVIVYPPSYKKVEQPKQQKESNANQFETIPGRVPQE